MCTKLTQNGTILVPGSKAVVRTHKGEKTLIWGLDNGSGIQANARLESLIGTWAPKGFTELGILEVESFFEKNTKFNFHKTGQLAVVYKDENFLLITEPANEQISKVHHRQPCMRALMKLADSFKKLNKLVA